MTECLGTVTVTDLDSFRVVERYVDFSGLRDFQKMPPAVIKFSEKDHALPFAGKIMLKSADYFRSREEGPDYIGDKLESRYEEQISIAELLRKNGQSRFSHTYPGIGTAEITWGRPADFWMFCTSLIPSSMREAKKLRQNLPDEYDWVTKIPEPAVFARRLGLLVARHLKSNDVVELDCIGLLERASNMGKTIIQVDHGLVIYTDYLCSFVERFPVEMRGTVCPFVKRRRYAPQQEYRFVLSVTGKLSKEGALVKTFGAFNSFLSSASKVTGYTEKLLLSGLA